MFCDFAHGTYTRRYRAGRQKKGTKYGVCRYSVHCTPYSVLRTCDAMHMHASAVLYHKLKKKLPNKNSDKVAATPSVHIAHPSPLPAVAFRCTPYSVSDDDNSSQSFCFSFLCFDFTFAKPNPHGDQTKLRRHMQGGGAFGEGDSVHTSISITEYMVRRKPGQLLVMRC